MHHLTVALESSHKSEMCVLCGRRPYKRSGLILADARCGGPVCRECGKHHAPNLVALIDLACVAERVGRVARHTLVPPLETLLDLARVAEEFRSTSAASATLKAA